MVEFRMPSFGADMEAGTLVEWLVKPGDQVKRGDIVAVVETQKGAIEIEIFQTGTVDRILVKVGTKVPIGTPLAVVRTQGEAPIGIGAAPTVPPSAAPAAERPAAPPAAPAKAMEPRPTPRLRVSPAAKRLAERRGVDLDTVAASGPSGTIVSADIERAITEKAAQRTPPTGFDLAAMRSAIAAAMARSKREIPHYYLAQPIEMNICGDWLARTNAKRPPSGRLLLGALLVKAVALAAAKFPTFNGFYRNDKFEPAGSVHVGTAIAIRGGGLIAPAIHDADRLSLDDLMRQMRELVQRVRAGRIRSSEIADPTITVSSLGERGVEQLFGIIYPPQVAILGFGKVVARPWIVEGHILALPVVGATLAADHRVTDGHAGALFLAEIERLLQEPDKL
ncbi:MAG: dihydrolipoamide acetyltransferase family protein [Methyloceanibacter sp.]